MNHMFLKSIEKNNNIININSNKVAKISKNRVDFFLYIKREILEIHDDYIELLLFSMRDNREFMTIDQLD